MRFRIEFEARTFRFILLTVSTEKAVCSSVWQAASELTNYGYNLKGTDKTEVQK